MDQQLGLSIERKLPAYNYLFILPKEIRSLLYKYLFKSSYKINITSNENIAAIDRIYPRQITLILHANDIKLTYKFDVNYIRQNYRFGEHISKFIDYTLGKPFGMNYLLINKYIKFFYYDWTNLINVKKVVCLEHGREPMSLFNEITLMVTADLLDALLTIEKMIDAY